MLNKKGFTQHHKNGAGFTLIELLVATGVMAVLMGISLVSYQGSKKAARDGKRKADIEQIRSALEIYRTDCKTYPTSGNFTALQGELVSATNANCSGNSYMSQVPGDPQSPTYSYAYVFSSPNLYYLCAYLETGAAASTNCAAGCVATCNYETKNP